LTILGIAPAAIKAGTVTSPGAATTATALVVRNAAPVTTGFWEAYLAA
jgi:hypothetical protein